MAILLSGAIGCAMPVPWSCEGGPCELVVGFASKDAANGRYRRVVAGLDARRGWLTQGLTIGWSDLRLLHASGAPGTPAAHPEQPAQAGLHMKLPFYLAWREQGGGENRLGIFLMGMPRLGRAFVHHVRGGVSVMAGRHDSGFEAGLTSATHVAVPLDEPDDGLYWIRYRSRDFGSSTYQRQETAGGRHR
jgi:hypothetical protein